MESSDREPFRAIPSLDEVLGAEPIARLREEHPHFPWTRFLREVTAELRSGKHGPLGEDRGALLSKIVALAESRVSALRSEGLRRVINGTGVILHTNLGRAILGEEAVGAVREAMSHYVSLEVDLDTGKRTRRGRTLEELLRLLSGAEDAMVVNNNAAAVWLVVDTYSPPGRVLVSRGELVEIGGSFRLPDILARASGEVVEVGTTNRTYASDYARLAMPGDILLKVHRSNYDITGFTHEAEIAELVRLGAERQCYVVCDLGSGCFFDFSARGLVGEKLVQEVLATGVHCVTASGDKLLGGVQAGLVLGRRDFLAKLKENPLRRAIRVDKTTIAALQAVCRVYLFDREPERRLPMLRQATEDREGLRERAEKIVAALSPGIKRAFDIRVVEDPATIGGGSFACEDLPSFAVSIRCGDEEAAVALAKKMRKRRVPILARIKSDEVRVNLRSVLPYEDGDLREGLEAVLNDR